MISNCLCLVSNCQGYEGWRWNYWRANISDRMELCRKHQRIWLSDSVIWILFGMYKSNKTDSLYSMENNQWSILKSCEPWLCRRSKVIHNRLIQFLLVDVMDANCERNVNWWWFGHSPAHDRCEAWYMVSKFTLYLFRYSKQAEMPSVAACNRYHSNHTFKTSGAVLQQITANNYVVPMIFSATVVTRSVHF